MPVLPEVGSIITEPGPTKPASKSPIEGYEILEKLGQGAMGVIYKARHLKLQRIVALKVLLPEFANDEEFIKRFFREARAAITLHHPNIIQGYHVDKSNGFYYFAMEFIEGGTVKERLEKLGVLTEEEATNIVIQICQALEHAQEHGIVHRDIKPDNIMIAKDGTAKLCDLGIAKEINQEGSLTQTGIALGTPYYISPEQAMGEKKIDIRSDIYSLGATFYHMITGKVPYDGDTSAVIMTKHISEEPPDPRHVNPTISDNVAEVILKMMAKEREYRYQTPTEVIEDLKQDSSKDTPRFSSVSSVLIQDGIKIPKPKRPLSKTFSGSQRPRKTTSKNLPRKKTLSTRAPASSKRFASQPSYNWMIALAVAMGIILVVLIVLVLKS
ncbi:MAG: serine/threonine protein kinase [Planctomycetota bacterium]|nr:MAG: serine/threonine protein kinase [Planctomycetota bacterium]